MIKYLHIAKNTDYSIHISVYNYGYARTHARARTRTRTRAHRYSCIVHVVCI